MNKRLLTLLSLALLAVLLIAQTTPKGSLSGVVRDTKRQALEGVKIECFLKTQLVASVKSDAKGAYVIRGLENATYRVTATLEGYEPWEKENVKISKGKAKTLNIKLKEMPVLMEVPEPVAEMEYDMITDGLAAPGAYYQQAMGKVSVADMAYSGGYYPPPLPPDWNTEDYNAITPNIFHSPFTEPQSTFSIDVDTATYSNVRRMLNEGQLPQTNMIRIEELLNYFSYDYPQPKGEVPFSVYTEMGLCPWNQKRNLVHIGIQGKKMDMSTAPANNLVFLLDVSGSMNDWNKLPLVKKSMQLLLDNMRPQDRIAIVVYAGAAGLALPSTSGEEKEKIIAALDNLEAGGSTAGGAGIKLAYKTALENMLRGGNNRIILCTDGDFNIGASSDADLTQIVEENRNKGVFLTVLGFGMGNYKDNKLELLADKGNGNYAYIDDLMEAKKVLVNEMGGTLYTIAKDVKIQVDFNPAHVKAYRLIGYENRMLRSEDFRDDTKDAGELGAGHTVTAIYEIIPAGSKETVAELDSLRYLEYKVTDEARKSPEMMWVKLRYKLPNSDTSTEIATPVYNKTLGLEDVSAIYNFSAAVVGYGLLLQNSEHKGALTWDMVRAMAKENMGVDKEGYRKDFLDLIEKAAKLSGPKYRED
jgi:Ca-activated chloride channel family protein